MSSSCSSVIFKKELSTTFTAVFSKLPFKKGDEIFRIIPLNLTETMTSHTIQYSTTLHIPIEDLQDFQYLSHSCEPNLILKFVESNSEKVKNNDDGKKYELSLVAKKDIQENEELSFDYTNTEYDMSTPFDCICGSKSCYKKVAGFKHLNETQQKENFEFITPTVRLFFEKEKLNH